MHFRNLVPALLPAMACFAAAGGDLRLPLQKRVLQNGLTVFLVERHQAPVFSARIAFRVGGVDEAAGQTGTAHLLEHMLFKGTRTVGLKNPAEAQSESLLLEAEDSLCASITAEQDRLEAASAASVYATGKPLPADSGKLKSLREEFAKVQAKHAAMLQPNAFSALFQEAGANGLNAGTSNDFTFYQVDLPRNRFEFWARMESERMNAPVLREFYTEREVVKEERRMRTEDSPEGRLRELFLGQAFLAHPYGRPVVGWPSDLYALKRTEVQDFYRRYYAPNRAAIVLVGDLTWDEINPTVDAYFGQLKRQPDPAPVRTVEPAQSGDRRTSMDAEATPVFMAGWHIPAMSHPDSPALAVLADLLSKGRSSRLYKRAVVELSIASDFQVSIGEPGSRYPNLLVATGTVKGDASPGLLGAVLMEEIEAIKQQGPAKADLERLAVLREMDQVRRMEDPGRLATDLAVTWAVAGDEQAFLADLDRYRSVTAADVQRVAKAYLVDPNRTTAVLLRPKAAEGDRALDGEIEATLTKLVELTNPAMKPSDVVDSQMGMIRAKPRDQRLEVLEALKKQLAEAQKTAPKPAAPAESKPDGKP
ncbi:MAG: insulinase family protein [Holophagaceae bacterium]|nr:insulinase family protein [Holophagaceae bacterium]